MLPIVWVRSQFIIQISHARQNLRGGGEFHFVEGFGPAAPFAGPIGVLANQLGDPFVELDDGDAPNRPRRRHLSDSLDFRSASPRSKLYVQSSDRSDQAFVAERCVLVSTCRKLAPVSTPKTGVPRQCSLNFPQRSRRPPGSGQSPAHADSGQSNTPGENDKVRHRVRSGTGCMTYGCCGRSKKSSDFSK